MSCPAAMLHHCQRRHRCPPRLVSAGGAGGASPVTRRELDSLAVEAPLEIRLVRGRLRTAEAAAGGHHAHAGRGRGAGGRVPVLRGHPAGRRTIAAVEAPSGPDTVRVRLAPGLELPVDDPRATPLRRDLGLRRVRQELARGAGGVPHAAPAAGQRPAGRPGHRAGLARAPARRRSRVRPHRRPARRRPVRRRRPAAGRARGRRPAQRRGQAGRAPAAGRAAAGADRLAGGQRPGQLRAGAEGVLAGMPVLAAVGAPSTAGGRAGRRRRHDAAGVRARRALQRLRRADRAPGRRPAMADAVDAAAAHDDRRARSRRTTPPTSPASRRPARRRSGGADRHRRPPARQPGPAARARARCCAEPAATASTARAAPGPSRPEHRSDFEFCENGAKAVAWEATLAPGGRRLLRPPQRRRAGRPVRSLAGPAGPPGPSRWCWRAGSDHYRPIAGTRRSRWSPASCGRCPAPTRRCSTPRAAPATRRRSCTSCSCASSAPTTCPTARTCATSRAAWRCARRIGVGKGTVQLEDFDAGRRHLRHRPEPGHQPPAHADHPAGRPPGAAAASSASTRCPRRR